MKRSSRILVVGKATISRWYDEAGIIRDPKHNGVALKGTGERRNRGVRAALLKMRWRVKKCLSTKPVAPIGPTVGMTSAERFHYRYHNDPAYRLYQLMRRRMRKVIFEGVKKPGECMATVGCTSQELKRHIESQFKHGMTWQNAGTGKGRWHVDHRIPVSAFDRSRLDQMRIACHWTNLQPLWSVNNMRKSNRFRDATPCLPM